MAKVKGWLYVGRTSATFVSEDRQYIGEELNWDSLANRVWLNDFLTSFAPVKQDQKSSHESYYIEVEERGLIDWFSRQSENNE